MWNWWELSVQRRAWLCGGEGKLNEIGHLGCRTLAHTTPTLQQCRITSFVYSTLQ